MPVSDTQVLLASRQAFFQRHFAKINHPLCKTVQRLLLVSDYAHRHGEILATLLHEDDCKLPLFADKYSQLLANIAHQPMVGFSRSLRQFRHYHFLRLLVRELSGLANTEETLTAWSDCADALILRTLSFCQQELMPRFGRAYEEAGNLAELYVLAMGKLGGRELNYSSDIDLIIAFSAGGFTDGGEVISNQQYYTKVVQLFIQLLQNVTAEGFVFRVDLRLRPNGDSGALVSSLAAMETYYQEQGRDWERYAMVKARLIGESTVLSSHWFNRLIIPFIYRRYVDFSVIESLRSMKAMIEREVQLNPRLDDIKRGLGGIREVEFIIQNFQLIRGGRIVSLRQQNALKTMEALKCEKLLPKTAALKQAYLFLRKLENCLQSFNDKQTHSLPKCPLVQMQITLAMGYNSWEKMIARLQHFQHIISHLFNATLRKVEDEDNERLLAYQLSNIWQGHVEQTMAVNLLQSLGYQQADRCYQLIHSFRHSPRCRRLTQAARLRLDRFMVLLLNELASVSETETVLLQVVHLLENIVGRSAYLALLTENLQALKELLYWFVRSPFITTLLVQYPFLLEVLLIEQSRWLPLSRNQLEQQLNSQLSDCHEIELQEEKLRQFKLTNWLLVARAQMNAHVDAVRIGRFLADVAEVIVTQVVNLACNQLKIKHVQIMKVKAQFAIIAYGKLGSREMNYDSDLDLVFIHNTKHDEEELVTRLTQKIMHMLTTRSHLGILYQVDTRLRPSGAAGLLVSTLPAFVDYQQNHAWIWEHQALIRGRILLGNSRILHTFKQLKQDIMLRKREHNIVRNDVLQMREKMNRHLEGDQVKYAPGGLLDLEFLVQFLILTNPIKNIGRYTNTLSLLQQLAGAEVINAAQFSKLRHAYKYYHQLLHQSLLCPCKLSDCKSEQRDIIAIYQELLNNV